MKHNEPDLARDHLRHGDYRFWDRQLRARIGQDLRAIFENTLEEPLPERISRVLGQMEGRPTAAGGPLHQFRKDL